MPRLMSVAYTEQQVRDRTKTVTRRKGWWWSGSKQRHMVNVGDQLTLCRKIMGRKPGEPLVRICTVEVVDVRRELLSRLHDETYGPAEVALEGFPGMLPRDFVHKFFIDAQGIQPSETITRIEWKYLDD